MGGSGCICLPTSSRIGQSVGEVAGLPMQENYFDCYRVTQQPWCWDLVAMSSQILSLPILTNLLTQPFNQIPQKSEKSKSPCLAPRASLIRWTSGHPLLSQLLTSLCIFSRTGSYNPAPLMVTSQPLLINC